MNVGEHAEHVVDAPEQAVHLKSHGEHVFPSKYVPVGQWHVDPVNVNVGAHAEQVVDAPEQAVHFESHWEHSLTLK